MKTLYLDTEFNGHGGNLISLALVDPYGPSWYEVLPYEHLVIDQWVVEHVLPQLHKKPISKGAFQKSLHKFLGHYLDAKVVSDWQEDFAHLLQWMTMPGGVSLRWTGPLQMVHTPNGFPVSAIPHNALADATALMEYLHYHPHGETRPPRMVPPAGSRTASG